MRPLGHGQYENSSAVFSDHFDPKSAQPLETRLKASMGRNIFRPESGISQLEKVFFLVEIEFFSS